METQVLFRYEKQVRSHHVKHFGELSLSPGTLDEISHIAEEYFTGVNMQNICIFGGCREWVPRSGKFTQSKLLEIIKEKREKGKLDPEIVLEAIENDVDVGYEIKQIIHNEKKQQKEKEDMKKEIENLMAEKRMNEAYERMRLKPWQRELENLLNAVPTRRVIHIISDERGGSGKTMWRSYMRALYSSKVLSLTPSETDNILYHAAIQYSGAAGPRVIICDVQRSHLLSGMLLGACELLKDGEFFSGKYAGRYVKWENKPHIVLLTNTSFEAIKRIQRDSLSFDRVRVGVMKKDSIQWFRLKNHMNLRTDWIPCSMLPGSNEEDDEPNCLR
jgi:hypothetical protein